MRIKVLHLVMMFLLGLAVCYGATDSEMLQFVNNPAITVQLLDNAVKLRSDVSANIVAMRPFATVKELDAVPYVGVVVMTTIKTYIDNNKVVAPVVVAPVVVTPAVVGNIKYIKDNNGKVVGVIKYNK